jgi:hypothetical protein
VFATLAGVGDRLLNLLVPKTVAYACQCQSNCTNRYRCRDGKYQRRNCCYTCTCQLNCTDWVTIGKCGN